MKNILTFLIIFMSTFMYSQTENNIDGTYTIYINSIKDSNIELSSDEIFQIKASRKEHNDTLINIENKSIYIMSNEKKEANIKWPKYSLTNK